MHGTNSKSDGLIALIIAVSVFLSVVWSIDLFLYICAIIMFWALIIEGERD